MSSNVEHRVEQLGTVCRAMSSNVEHIGFGTIFDVLAMKRRICCCFGENTPNSAFHGQNVVSVARMSLFGFFGLSFVDVDTNTHI